MASFDGNQDIDLLTSESEDSACTDNDDSTIHNYFYRGSYAFRNLLRNRSSHRLLSDTEENVQRQTEDVFMNYMYQSFNLETDRGELCDTPTPQDLLNLSRNPLTPAAEVGRRLASIGDTLDRQYNDLDGLASSLCQVDAYEAFADIARRVFTGGIRWNKILILLRFGYRMAINNLQQSASDFSSFLSRIVSFMVKFIVTEKIARWIAEHGGWTAAMSFNPSTPSSLFYAISGLAAIAIFAVVIRHKFF